MTYILLPTKEQQKERKEQVRERLANLTARCHMAYSMHLEPCFYAKYEPIEGTEYSIPTERYTPDDETLDKYEAIVSDIQSKHDRIQDLYRSITSGLLEPDYDLRYETILLDILTHPDLHLKQNQALLYIKAKEQLEEEIRHINHVVIKELEKVSC